MLAITTAFIAGLCMAGLCMSGALTALATLTYVEIRRLWVR